MFLWEFYRQAAWVLRRRELLQHALHDALLLLEPFLLGCEASAPAWFSSKLFYGTTWSHCGLFEGTALFTSRVSPPGPTLNSIGSCGLFEGTALSTSRVSPPGALSIS